MYSINYCYCNTYQYVKILNLIIYNVTKELLVESYKQ